MRNHEPCAKALGNYIYVCNASAHAQRMRRIIIIIITCICVQWVAMVFLVYREGMQLPLVAIVLREAFALMRTSSIYTPWPRHIMLKAALHTRLAV